MVVQNGTIPNGITGEPSISMMLLKCIEGERVDVLRSILVQTATKPDFHEQVDQICCNDGTILHYAVNRNSVDSTRTLLSAGVNPCVQNDDNNTAYQLAASEEMKNAFFQELLQATANSNLSRVCQLISVGVSVNTVDSPYTGNTALHWAASYGNEDVVRIICQSGANVNASNMKGETALHDAVRRGNSAVVKCLLLHGADPNFKDKNGLDCYELAAQLGGAMLPCLSLDRSLNRTVRRAASTDTEIDCSSIMSTETLFGNKAPNQNMGRLESWTDLLWPQPKYITLDERKRMFPYPKDCRLKIYFDGASEAEPRRVMQIIQLSAPLLSGIQLELDYRGHKIPEHSSLDGRITCGIFESGRSSGSYSLTINEDGIDLYGEDYIGIRHGFSTLVQILRIHKTDTDSDILLETLHETPFESSAAFTLTGVNQPRKTGAVPCLTVWDSPDSCFRAVFQDFSGCKILNTETLLQFAARICYCKASHLFVNFEVRTTDRYQLPYTNRDLFHMNQVCDELFVKLVPSLDVQASHMEPDVVYRVVESFLDDHPLTKVVHFGPNLATVLISNPAILNGLQRRVPRIYISVEIDEKNADSINQLPPYVTLCLEGRYPFEAENLLSPRLNVVLRFSTSDPGFLCAAPESIVRKALLASRLSNSFPVLGAMVCDLSTGCEIMPPSLSYMPELASLGVCWNRSVDMKRFHFLLPRITAEHFLLDGNMEALFKQIYIIGMVEHEITKYSYGLLKSAESAVGTDKEPELPSLSKVVPVSVFVEVLLNPDNMILERVTPFIFKKARIELKRSLKTLDQARERLPHNYELALVLGEIELVTELVVLLCKLGQSLCMHGVNPSLSSNDRKVSVSSSDKSLPEMAFFSYPMVNIGVSNLPLTIRTDLANSLLEIRSRFHHVWLSRNIASTLSNALKIFDNLFRMLLPPSLEDFGKNLL